MLVACHVCCAGCCSADSFQLVHRGTLHINRDNPLAQCRPLCEVLAEIPDFRAARGKRHPLAASLCLVCVAIL